MKRYVMKLVMIVMLVAVHDAFSMRNDTNRKIEFNLSNDNGNLLKPQVSVTIYAYNPNTGSVTAGGFDLNTAQGSMRSRTMDLYKGPLIDQPQSSEKKSKLPKMRRSTYPEIQQAVKEGYIQKIEIEESHGITFTIDPETIDVINRILDDNPEKLLTFQITKQIDRFNGSKYYTINLIGSRELRDL